MPRWEWGFYQLGIPFGIGWAQFDADGPLADGDIPGANYTLALKSDGAPTYFLGVYNGFKLGEKLGALPRRADKELPPPGERHRGVAVHDGGVDRVRADLLDLDQPTARRMNRRSWGSTSIRSPDSR